MKERVFNKEFKKDFMKMEVGEDWNALKEKYDVSSFLWDIEMQKHFNNLVGKYSDGEARKK